MCISIIREDLHNANYQILFSVDKEKRSLTIISPKINKLIIKKYKQILCFLNIHEVLTFTFRYL